MAQQITDWLDRPTYRHL